MGISEAWVEQYWTTNELPEREQFSYWHEVLCQAFTPLRADRESKALTSGLSSWVKSAPLGTTTCAEVSSSTQRISHGRTEVSRTSKDQIFVNLMLRGSCIVQQDGRSVVVPAGSFSLVDTSREYYQDYVEDQAAKEWRVLSFRLSRDSLLPLLAEPLTSMAIAYNGQAGGMGTVAATTMVSVWRNLRQLDAHAANSTEAVLTTVIVAATGRTKDLRASQRPMLDNELRAAINRYISANLRSAADLSAHNTAKRFLISVRKLHDLYQKTELTYAQTIMSLRLEACARELTSEQSRTPLSQLATKWGFCDLSHLNRAFRGRYHCLPSEYRQTAADAA